jgi:hypothetical protein
MRLRKMFRYCVIGCLLLIIVDLCYYLFRRVFLEEVIKSDDIENIDRHASSMGYEHSLASSNQSLGLRFPGPYCTLDSFDLFYTIYYDDQKKVSRVEKRFETVLP